MHGILQLGKKLYFEIILNLQKSCKESRESSCLFFSLPLMLIFYITIEYLSKLKINFGIILLMKLYLDFTCLFFTGVFFFLFRNPVKNITLHSVQFFLIIFIYIYIYMSFSQHGFHSTTVTKNVLRFLVAGSLTSRAITF